MIYICETCGREFQPRRGRAKRYCSSECYFNRAGGRIEEQRPCAICGKDFWPRDQEQRACSAECGRELRDRRVELVCEWCKKPFLAKRTEAGRRVCCTRKCSAQLREQQHRDEWLSGKRGRYINNGYVVIQ